MQPARQVAPVSRTSLWAGRVLSALVLLLIGFTAMFGVLKTDVARQGFAIPRTAVLGAILLAGNLGGATATHVRVGEPFFLPVIVGIVIWLGLYLRDHRVCALVPFRSAKMPLINP
jgi:hypothetical protein